ncbi:uncharacterized protein LOC111068584 [Drosophila obscura]|uniref:uncharacterized protein LOC111068584 n=1 Tax=Drosophila obscura TaxID=7282 RepID=UPI000BA073C8|nr:uncharacterized protein LOC111068584 [Drosophila obscura]
MDWSVSKYMSFDPDQDEEERQSYNHKELKTFLANSTIKDHFGCAHQISDSKRLLSYLSATLSSYAGGVFNLEQLLDLYILAIMMMTYDEENFMVTMDRCMLADIVSNLGDSLELKQIHFIANGLYDKLVLGVGAEQLENVFNVEVAIPPLVLSSGHGRHVAMALLLTILGRYTKVPVKLQETGNARNIFEMAKLVNWQELADSGQYKDMFLLMRSICLLLNMRKIREEFIDDDLEVEMHKFFLKVHWGLGKSDNQTAFVTMVERFIAFCVVRGARKNVM